MTQTDVGSAVGRPQSCVSTWENGLIEMGVDRVLELDRLFGRAEGSLLLESGYVTPEALHHAEVRRAFEVEGGYDTDTGVMDDFPQRVMEWLADYGALIDAAVVLRRTSAAPNALEALLASGPMLQLRLSWEIWAELRGGAYGPTSDPGPRLSQPLFERCREALWGQEPGGGGPLRLVQR